MPSSEIGHDRHGGCLPDASRFGYGLNDGFHAFQAGQLRGETTNCLDVLWER